MNKGKSSLADVVTNKSLKEYLNQFPDDVPVSLILANPRKRVLYKTERAFAIKDYGKPVFCIDVGEEEDMDAEMVAAYEEDENNAKEMKRPL